MRLRQSTARVRFESGRAPMKLRFAFRLQTPEKASCQNICPGFSTLASQPREPAWARVWGYLSATTLSRNTKAPSQLKVSLARERNSPLHCQYSRKRIRSSKRGLQATKDETLFRR